MSGGELRNWVRTCRVLSIQDKDTDLILRTMGSLKECAMSVNAVVQLVNSGTQEAEKCIQGKADAEGRQRQYSCLPEPQSF